MPHDPTLQLDFRPDYFSEFDRLLQQHRDAVPAVEIRAEVLAALHLEGRHINAERLAGELDLAPTVVSLIERLGAFGDDGLLIHHFGAVCVATINAGSDVGACDQTTFVFARRCARGIEFFFEDENGGRGDLGTRDRPLSMIEAVILIDAVLVAQAPYDVVEGDWRNGYLVDDSMIVTVNSEIYPQLREWYRRSVREWNADNQRKG